MNNKKFWQIIILALVVAALVFGIPRLTKKEPIGESVPATSVAPQAQTITLTVEGLYSNKTVTIASAESVLNALQALNNTDPQMKLVTKEYSGLGTLVQGIGSLANGANGEYWQYKVNGVMPQVGADQYKLKNGDSVEWYFDKSAQ